MLRPFHRDEDVCVVQLAEKCQVSTPKPPTNQPTNPTTRPRRSAGQGRAGQGSRIFFFTVLLPRSFVSVVSCRVMQPCVFFRLCVVSCRVVSCSHACSAGCMHVSLSVCEGMYVCVCVCVYSFLSMCMHVCLFVCPSICLCLYKCLACHSSSSLCIYIYLLARISFPL